MGQRIKRDLASHGKSRGSRAGEHEQPNAGRKRKRHFFFLRFVGRTLSHARRQGVTRNARTCENLTRKASLGPGDHADLPRRAKIEAQALQNASGRPVGQAKAVASRSGTLWGRSEGMPCRARVAPWARRGRPERRQQRPGSLREHTGRRRRRADTEIVRSCRATCVAKRAGDVFSSAAAFRTNRPTCVSTQF